MEREQASADMAAALDAFGKRPVAVAGGNLYAALRASSQSSTVLSGVPHLSLIHI